MRKYTQQELEEMPLEKFKRVMKEKGVPFHRHYMYYDPMYGRKDPEDYIPYAPELPQCPRCKTYTDDPEHWCGSVGLVLSYGPESPRFWTGDWVAFWEKEELPPWLRRH